MKRSQAERFIDKIRRVEAEHRDCALDGSCDMHQELQELLEEAGIPPLVRCPGEVKHGFIDNCPTCAPRWGWVGERVKVT